MEAHPGACDANFQHHFREWKRCPKCRIFIQKDEGCNHMTCNCAHQFCFVCMADWEQSHYECIEGLENRMFFDDNNEPLGPTQSVFYLFLVLLVFPFVILLYAFLIALTIVGGCVLGAIISPCIALKQLGSACVACLFIVLPIAIVMGAIGVPIFLFISLTKPFMIRNFTQYCNTVSYLKGSL